MTTPVCPACRTMLSLDAHACPRCGLAVRPTCSNCGEALEVRMHACPRCWEVIDQPSYEGAIVTGPVTDYRPYVPEIPEGSAAQAAASTMTLTQQPAYADLSMPVAPRTKRGWLGQAIGLGILTGVLLTIALLALDALTPQIRGTGQPRLERQGFPALDFSIQVPEGWDARTENVGGRPAVMFTESADVNGDERGFAVVVENRSFEDVRKAVDAKKASSSYHEIGVVDGLRIDLDKAFRHMFLKDGDEYREAWWIDREHGTFRIEFWAPVSRREESAPLFVRIARTFESS